MPFLKSLAPSSILTSITNSIPIPNQVAPEKEGDIDDDVDPIKTYESSTTSSATNSSRSTESDKLIVLITGANQGLGYSTAHALAATGRYHVLVGARSPQKSQDAIKALAELGVTESAFSAVTIDLTADASINMAQLFVESAFGRLDILINNAGIGPAQLNALSLREQYLEIFNTNVFGTASVTQAFLPLLHKSTFTGKRIVNVSSGMGSLAYSQDDSSPYSADKMASHLYRSTKAALNMLTVIDAAQLKKEGIEVVSVCPGYMKTNFNANSGYKSPDEGAKAVVRAVTAEHVGGKFVTDDHPDGFFPW